MPPDYNPLGDPMAKPDDPNDKKDDDKPTEPAAPDPQAAVEAANKRAADAEARLETRSKDYDQKVDQFTTALTARYDQKTQQQEPDPKVELTDADVDKAPIATQRMVAREEVQEELQKVGQYYGAIIGNLSEQAFEGQMEGIKSERFYDYVKDDIQAFFEKNPENKISPKAARTIYNQYVGERIDELLEKDQAVKDQEGRAQDDLIHQRPVRPDVRSEPAPRSPAARVLANPRQDEPELAPDEDAVFQIFKNYGFFKDAKEWREWSSALGTRPREEIPQDYTLTGRA